MSLANDKKASPRESAPLDPSDVAPDSAAFGERTVELAPAAPGAKAPPPPVPRRAIQRSPLGSAPSDAPARASTPSEPQDNEDEQPTRVAHTTTGPVPKVPSARASKAGTDAATKPEPPARPAPIPSLSGLLDEDGSFGDDLSVSDAETDPYVGTVLADRYVLGRVLGEGGMGKVYRAHHKVIEKKVAVKVLHAELAKDKEAVGRFLREARAASSIGNPHIVDILDFGEAPDGATYFVMEYLNGQSLGDVLADLTRISSRTTVELALQLCDGLAAAHAEGIVHRDLKPDNVVLVKPKGTWAGQGHFVKILDFGIAKVTGVKGNTSKLTMAGAVFGTPHYMSPEQASGDAVDQRTDIYSLGVMLFEMLSGDVPFRAENFMGILTQHIYKAPPSLRDQAGEGEPCPAALEAIILKCMAKRPEARYQSMEELAADLLLFKETGETRAASSPMSLPDPVASVPSQLSPPSSGEVPRQGRGLAVALSVIVALTLGAAAIGFALLREPAKPAKTEATAAPVTATAAPNERAVLLYSDVSDAYAVVDGKPTKLPDTVMVPSGRAVSVRVEAGADYEATTVEVDGQNTKLKVELRRKAGASASAAASTAAPLASGVTGKPIPGPLPGLRPKPRPNPEGVVDPW
ncbi:MAG: serine/threonine protein kinase [Deltaproteobacteria bacterium]|nr:serine/threonine protein kinase [Deltaproteobacteria bacterium]